MSILLSFILTLNSAVFPRANAGEKPLPDHVVNHIFIQGRLDRLFQTLDESKSLAAFERDALSRLPARDREPIRKKLQSLTSLPKFTRLNRGVAFTVGEQRYTIAFEDYHSRRFRINERVTWIYQENNPLDVQIQVLAKALDKPQASVSDFFINRAHATGIELLIGAVITVIIGAMLVPTGSDIWNNYYRAKQKREYCDNKKPDTSYEDYKYCEDVFKWKKETRGAKVPFPDAKPAPATQVKTEEVKRAFTCPKRSREDKQMFVDAEDLVEIPDPDKPEIKKKVKVITRHTVHFDKTNKPTKIIQESVEPVSDRKLTFSLAEGKIESVSDGAKMFLSRKPEHGSVMDEAKFKELDRLEQGVGELVSFIVTCNNRAEDALTAAEQPASLLATEVVKTVSSTQQVKQLPAAIEK